MWWRISTFNGTGNKVSRRHPLNISQSWMHYCGVHSILCQLTGQIKSSVLFCSVHCKALNPIRAKICLESPFLTAFQTFVLDWCCWIAYCIRLTIRCYPMIMRCRLCYIQVPWLIIGSDNWTDMYYIMRHEEEIADVGYFDKCRPN